MENDRWKVDITRKIECVGGGNGSQHQYSCLENSMDRGAGQAVVHGVTTSNTTELTDTKL